MSVQVKSEKPTPFKGGSMSQKELTKFKQIEQILNYKIQKKKKDEN